MAFFFIKSTPHNGAPLDQWNDADRKLFDAHTQYWHSEMAAGKVHMYGRVEDPAGPFSIAILETDDEAELNGLIEQDPGKTLYDFQHHPVTHVRVH